MESRVIIMKNVEPERSCIVLEILSHGHEDDYGDECTSTKKHSHLQQGLPTGVFETRKMCPIGMRRSEWVIYFLIAVKGRQRSSNNWSCWFFDLLIASNLFRILSCFRRPLANFDPFLLCFAIVHRCTRMQKASQCIINCSQLKRRRGNKCLVRRCIRRGLTLGILRKGWTDELGFSGAAHA